MFWQGVRKNMSEKVVVNNITYEVIENVRDGWKEASFLQRYSDILNKFDYIVGDWGYEQLRLRGFYEDTHRKASYDTRISTLTDYILEYCNFGCAYFVVKKIKSTD
ncbi:YutD family protein [Terrilactibacillus tamarindi]